MRAVRLAAVISGAALLVASASADPSARIIRKSVHLTRESTLCFVEGTVENTGTSDIRFVRVLGQLVDRKGGILDTQTDTIPARLPIGARAKFRVVFTCDPATASVNAFVDSIFPMEGAEQTQDIPSQVADQRAQK